MLQKVTDLSDLFNDIPEIDEAVFTKLSNSAEPK